MSRPAGLSGPYPAQWSDPGMADAYAARPPYDPAAIDQLVQLARPGLPVLDLGAGTGDLARPLADRGLQAVGLEPSAAMIAAGRQQPGGQRVQWLEGRAEDTPLDGPFGLVTAGESIHWMDLDTVLPRVSAALAPGAFLALVYRRDRLIGGFGEALQALITATSTNLDYVPYHPVEMVGASRWFEPVGDWQAAPRQLEVTVAHYLRSLHSRNGLGPGHLGEPAHRAFDEAATRLLTERYPTGRVALTVSNRVHWGRLSH